MDMLSLKKDVVAAEVEAKVLEATEYPDQLNNCSHPKLDTTHPEPMRRTQEYLINQARQRSKESSDLLVHMDRLSEEHMEHHSSATLFKVENCLQPSNTNYGNLSHHSAKSANQDTYDKGDSPHPAPHQTDFLRYFARRELVATGLLKFDDRPESYRSGKHSFKNSIKGVGLSASEEVDLLVKWFGKESA